MSSFFLWVLCVMPPVIAAMVSMAGLVTRSTSFVLCAVVGAASMAVWIWWGDRR